MTTHEREFDRELGVLKNMLLRMAAIAESMIDETISELTQHEAGPAAHVPQQEEQLDALQVQVDEEAMMLLATQQPVAVDLRFIFAVTKINGEIERIGDLAVNITQEVGPLLRQPQLGPLVDIPTMADQARAMVRQSLEAFVQPDALLAQRVIGSDDRVDALYYKVVREGIAAMAANPATVERGIALIMIARHLERIADHATNIAEDVIYMSQGKDVRHPKK